MTSRSRTKGDARSVWFTSKRCAEIRPTPVSEPEQDQVLVRATASLISSGTEMLVYRGEAPLDSPMTTMGEGSYAFPIKYGYQCVGRVERAGSETGLEEGDRVFTRHPHQDFFTRRTDGRLVTKLPDSVSDDAATFLNLAEVALNAVLDVPVRVGDVAVVFGQGVVGMLCGRFARLTAGRLIVVDRLPMRRKVALQFGADLAVAPEDAAAAVEEMSEGRGADVIFEATGAPKALQSAIDLAGQEGTIVVLSFYGTRPVELRLAPEFHWRRQRIVSSQTGSLGSGLQPRWDARRRTQVALESLPRLAVEDLITTRVPFEQAARAYQLVDERPDEVLGLVLDYPRPFAARS